MNAFRSPVEKLEDRRLMTTIKGTDIRNFSDANGAKDNGQYVIVKFSDAVTSANLNNMRMFGYANNTLQGGQTKTTINIKKAYVNSSDNKTITLETDVQIRKGAQLTLSAGAVKNAAGEDVTGTIRTGKGLNRDRFTLALRAFRPNDSAYFAAGTIAGGRTPVSTSSAPSDSSVRTALSNFFDKKIKEKQIDAAKKTAMLSLFDSQASKDIAPAANLRAAIVSLAGTIAEPAITTFLGSDNSTGKVPITVTFNSGDIGSGAKDAELAYTKTGRLKLTFASDYVGESFVALSARIAHEALHDGGSANNIDSRDEEVVANYVESVVYAQQIVPDYTYAQKGTAYTLFSNYRLLLAINSGDRQFPRTGINEAPLKTGTVANPGFTNNNNYSFANTRSFQDSINKEYTGRISEKDPTPITGKIATILNNLTGNKYTTSNTTFSDNLINSIDTTQDILGDAYVMRVARVLQVTV